jgi:hypothetical protein
MTAGSDDEGQAPEHGDHGGDAPTMADVRKVIGEEISSALEPFKKLLGGGGAAASAPAAATKTGDGGPVADLDAMVESAISKVLGDKEAQSKQDEHAKEHERLAAAEKAPVARPKRSRWLGNIFD